MSQYLRHSPRYSLHKEVVMRWLINFFARISGLDPLSRGLGSCPTSGKVYHAEIYTMCSLRRLVSRVRFDIRTRPFIVASICRYELSNQIESRHDKVNGICGSRSGHSCPRQHLLPIWLQK